MNRIPKQIISTELNSTRTVYRKTELENGIRIVTEAIPYVRSVSIGVFIGIGSRDETDNLSGISHFIEHMVFKGTKKYSALQIAKNIEGYGGYINGFTSKENTCFYVRISDEQVERSIDVLAELIRNPIFKPEDIEKEKLVVIEELKNIEDNPEDYIYELFDKELYSDHTLGNSIIGNENSIKEFSRRRLIDFLKSYYSPSKMIIAAAGNINHDVLVRLVKNRFTNFNPKNSLQKKRLTPSKRGNGKFIQENKPIQQAHICLGTITPSIKSRYRFPLIIMNSILGDGMSSRLFQNIREKYGFSYNIGSFLNMYSDIGNFGVYSGTNKKNIQNTIELIKKEFSKLQKHPVSKNELERIKTQVKGSIVLSLESMSNRMMRLGTSELYFNEFITLDSTIKKIDTVTFEDIHEVSHKILNYENFTTIIFSPISS